MTNYFFFGGVAIVTAVDLFFFWSVVEDIKFVWNPRTRPN